MSTGCSCTRWKGKSCSLQFTKDYVKDVQLSCMELTTTELDLVITGQLLACTNTSQRTITDVHQPVHYCCKQNHTNFLHRGSPICTGTFRFLHAVGAKRMKNFLKSLKTNGIAPSVHGNTRRVPHNPLTFNRLTAEIKFPVVARMRNCFGNYFR